MEDIPKNSKESLESMIQRRQATTVDTEFARRIHHVAMHDVIMRQFGSWDQEEQDRFFSDSWNPDATEIITDGSTDIGYCSIEDTFDDLYIHNLYISPEYQGKGIGTKILNEVLTRATERNIPVLLQVFKQNRAHELYKKLGFEDIEESSTKYFMKFQPRKAEE